MTKKMLSTVVVLLLFIFFLIPAVASTIRELKWDDLVPKSVVFNDPFAEMEREKLEYLGFVARVRGLVAAGKQVSQETRNEAAELEAELKKEGIDIEGLFARRDEIRELRRKQAGAVVNELDGVSVKMPGYLLPLEFSDQEITEFLLVPWVGACIHTPPPPPNQIVHVVFDQGKGYKSRSIYEPVWVVGQLSTRASIRNLYLKDGSSDINIGYKLQANFVERYNN